MDDASAPEGPFAHLRPVRLGKAPKIAKAPPARIERNRYVTREAGERFSQDRIPMASDPHFDSGHRAP